MFQEKIKKFLSSKTKPEIEEKTKISLDKKIKNIKDILLFHKISDEFQTQVIFK